MNIIQGFIRNPKLADNRVDQVAPFGELSPKSLTYTRTIKYFTNPETYPEVEFVAFKALDGSSDDMSINTFLSHTIINVAGWTYNQSEQNAIPTNANKLDFINALTAEFSNLVDSYQLATNITNVAVGELLETTVSGQRLPDFISFNVKDNDITFSCKFWFSDSKFQQQYLYYDLVVVPPVSVIDELNGTTADVSSLISTRRTSQVISNINAITQNHPETSVYPITLVWRNPENPTSTLNTEWFVVVYGAAGNDLDVIKDAIRSYISDNSNVNNWTSIYPDLYAESEFILIPFWDLHATPDNGYDEGLYQSGITYSKLKNVISNKTPSSYDTVTDFDAYLDDNLTINSSTYRSLLFYTLGNPNNTNGQFNFMEFFPDYMDISTSSPDFSRLSTRTQSFCTQLNEALHKAREYSLTKPMPTGYTKSVKANREYIGFDFEGFTFYIMTRLGYMKAL